MAMETLQNFVNNFGIGISNEMIKDHWYLVRVWEA